MRRSALLQATLASMTLFRIGLAADQPGSKPAPTANQLAAQQPAADPDVVEVRLLPRGRLIRRVIGQLAPQQQGKVQQPSADEAAIRATGDTYVEAFTKGDAKATAAHFTEDAEYVDCHGQLFHGRKAIENLMTGFFSKNPGSKIELEIDAIRMISPGVAIEDGASIVTLAGGTNPESETFLYTAVHVKQNGKWLVASVRDRQPENPRQHKNQLQQLSWMIGDWVHEGDGAIVHFNCRASESGNFLLRDFTVHVAGGQTMTGTQRIGWDAQSGKFRTWVFDSDGGFGEGSWHRDGNDWVLKLNGVTADGQSASSTSIYSYVDKRTMTFRSVNHEIGGVQLEDSEPVTIVRTSPQPQPQGGEGH